MSLLLQIICFFEKKYLTSLPNFKPKNFNIVTTTTAIISLLLLILIFFSGWRLYRRSMRIRNRLQMNQIFTNISHELLTPLTVISASVERLREQAPDHTTDYALMELNIERMTRLLQEILETSKSQAGELRLRVSQGDVMEYIQQTAFCIEPLMHKNGLEFSVQCNPRSMMGWIDTDKIDKIIYNLLSNAAKYTNSPGKVQLIANTNKNFDHIIIKVSDTGIGIPPQKMKHLFQRFYDGDYRRMKVSGTGIGLALTRDLVYLHGGTINCESQEGVGTTFTVNVPINKEAFNASQIDEKNHIDITKPRSTIIDLSPLIIHPEERPATAAQNPQYTILLVEDNEELLMLMETLLCGRYNILTATNGIEALDVVQKNNKIDLIVSDVMMPMMDGNELTQKIKSNSEWSHLPVILLSAKTNEDDRKASMLIGADDYMTKPFRLSDLKLRIDNIIENRKRIVGDRSASYADEEDYDALSQDEKFLYNARSCVLNHLSDSDFDRETFAAEMGASSSTLYNKLRTLTGMNVSNYIRDIRLKEARQLAESRPDIRVSDLAYKVGFKDPKYFATCFKNLFGVTPTEFIESSKQ